MTTLKKKKRFFDGQTLFIIYKKNLSVERNSHAFVIFYDSIFSRFPTVPYRSDKKFLKPPKISRLGSEIIFKIT